MVWVVVSDEGGEALWVEGSLWGIGSFYFFTMGIQTSQ